MSIELILGGIGTLLGITNFVYWAWWAKRDRVTIVIDDTWADFVPKGEETIGPGEKLVTVNDHCMHILVTCSLILTRGEREIEVKGVMIRLHKPTIEKLEKYFRVPKPNWNRFPLHKYGADPMNRELGVVLQPKKSVDFTEDRLFNCTDEFKEEYENIGSGTIPDFIELLIEQLGREYQICWMRYDGREICWKFPKTWWRNLGKRLWG